MKYLPYNPKLTKLARKNRQEPTQAEKKMWFAIFGKNQFQGYKFLRQKPIDQYIVDFYCAELMLAIEIDGDTHAGKEENDLSRTQILNQFGIKVIRYTDDEILNSIEGVYDDLAKKVNLITHITHPFPPLSGREPIPPLLKKSHGISPLTRGDKRGVM
ncbi:endonuclease [bacterium (Candidatus Torokbacteria) CG09_land_8_20_14_0_10_42_11]|nr:MAG: endonuclease [bacterium (Candidatus Torokbacteria) CG09_land_8_20_14_0_10_42_11]